MHRSPIVAAAVDPAHVTVGAVVILEGGNDARYLLQMAFPCRRLVQSVRAAASTTPLQLEACIVRLFICRQHGVQQQLKLLQPATAQSCSPQLAVRQPADSCGFRQNT